MTRLPHRGFVLIELMIGLAVAAVIMVALMQHWERQEQEKRSTAMGQWAAQVVNSLRSYISMNPDAAEDTYTDLNFLRSTSCPDGAGTADQHYLPCEFRQDPAGWPVVGYEITIENDGIDPLRAVIEFDPIEYRGEVNPTLSGTAAVAANTAPIQYWGPANSATYWAFENDPQTGVLTGYASTESNNDAYLRTDGSNSMRANIDFDDDGSGRDIENAETVYAERSESSEEALAPIYRDLDDPDTFYVDPTQDSVLRRLELRGDAQLIGNRRVEATGRLDIASGGDNDITLDPGAGEVRIDGSGRLNVEDIYLRDRDQWISRLLPRFVHMSTFIVGNGSYVDKPSCPGGTPKIQLTSQQTLMRQPGNTNARWAHLLRADNAGSRWRIVNLSYRSATNTVAGGRALAKTYCHYN